MADQKFGINQIQNPQPKWAKNFFRVFFYVTSLASIAVMTFTKMPDAVKLEITEWVTFANLAAHIFSKMWGVDVSEYEPQQNNRV